MPRPEITDELLIAFAAGDLAGEPADRVARHLDSDPAAARTVELYRLVAARYANDDSVPVPPAVLARAKQIFDRTGDRAPGWPERFVTTIARLVFDSRLQPAAVRFSDVGDQFQLGFATEDGEIDLHAQRLETNDVAASRRWRLMGQYAADEGPAHLHVALFRSGQARPVAETRADARSVFTLEIDAGDYEMHLTHPGAEIVLPGIEIR